MKEIAQMAKMINLDRPRIVCLCGSTRFGPAFREMEFRETLAGKIVVTIGCNMKSDGDLFGDMGEAARQVIKQKLDELHLRKIDLADEVLILNVDGYIGESTKRELEYARRQGKHVRFLETVGAPNIRDPEARCDEFLPIGGAYEDNRVRQCDTDGHYLCSHCVNAKANARNA